MSSKVFSCTHRVSYAECTLGNHVYHSRFLDILERARGEFFRALNCGFVTLQEQGAIFPVTRCRMRFLSMARYDETLTVEQWLTEIGRARFSCAGRISGPGGNPVNESVIQFACTTVEGGMHRLPIRLSGALQPYLAPGSEPESLR